jgi:SAUR family protein
MKKGGGASRRRSLKAFLQAWKRLASSQQATGGGRAHLDGEAIPRDVPRGHTVVYVGEELRRYVVRVSCLDHPLFRELLDRARDEYDFAGADARPAMRTSSSASFGMSTPSESGGWLYCAPDHGALPGKQAAGRAAAHARWHRSVYLGRMYVTAA